MRRWLRPTTKKVLLTTDVYKRQDNKEYRYLFVVSCKNSKELFRFEIRLVPVTLKEVHQSEKTKGTTA